MSQGPCRLVLYTDGNFGGTTEEHSGDGGVTHNDAASSVKFKGNCSNTSWGLFEHNDGDNKEKVSLSVRILRVVQIFMMQIITVRVKEV